jgi:2-keto-4-pentenoate hydratase/2-oxohepta-3-ene-1,7-dioic acid hydratase in catechol pathway
LFAAAISDAAEPTRYLRFQKGETIAYGLLEGDRVRQLSGDLFGTWTKTETTHALKDVKLLPPTRPSQVLALAGNYRSHLADETIPPKFQIPQLFFKSPSCLVGQGDAIVIPKDAKTVHYEAELTIVIGKKARNVSEESALDYVFGYTVANDISARDWQRKEMAAGFLLRGKGFDTFCPIGPAVVTDIDASDLEITLRHNGEVKQHARTSDLLFSVPYLIANISQTFTLEPGDVILTGTPSGVGPVQAGDTIEVEIEKIGVLRNTVVAEK